MSVKEECRVLYRLVLAVFLLQGAFAIGAFLALVLYDDLEFSALGESFNREFDDEFTFGVNVGFDVPFGSETPWAFAGSLKYLAATAEGDNFDGELDVDPLIVTAGIAYRFK